MTTFTTQTKDLWAIAIAKVEDDDRAQLDISRTDKVAVLDDLLSLVSAKQTICLQKRWKFKKSSGESIVVRDLVDKIALWVGKFAKVGDAAAQYDPTHAALPWAAIRFLLQITFNDVQTFGTLAEGVETVSKLIARYAIFEAAYLHPSSHTPSESQERLSEALIVLYSAILTYLAKAGRYYSQSTAERLAKSIVRPADAVQRGLELIRKEEMAVDKLADIMHAEMISALTKNVSSLHDDSTNKIEALEKLIKALDDPLVRTVGTLQDIQDQLKAEERRGLLTWLSRIPYREHHDMAYRDVLPGTGLWLLQKAKFLDWRTSSSSSTLWLHGIPGAGKSKLSAIVIQKLLEDAAGVEHAAPLAYFYCSREKTESRRADATEVLRAILKQLSCSWSDGQVRHVIAAEYKQRRLDAERDGLDVRTLAFSECTQLILDLTSEVPATIVIDGVDELSNSSHELLSALQHLVDKSSSVVKILVSSREDAAIARSLHYASSIRVASADNSKDVTTFVNHHVSKVIEQKRLLGGVVSNSLREDIISEIIDGTGEMFLWASLQLQHLCNGRVFKLEEDVAAALKRLPPTLEEILDSVYRSVNELEEEAKRIAKQVFAWLLAAQAPILASDMMASLIGRNRFARKDSKEPMLSVEIVLDICCNLLIFDRNSISFCFIHPSVREYLERHPEFSSTITHHLAFQCCLEYYTDVPSEVEVHCEENPLSDGAPMNIRTYAACYWGLHYSRIEEADTLAVADTLLLEFAFDHEGTCFQEWLDDAKGLTISLLPWDLRFQKLAAIQSASRTPLIAACVYGLLSVIESMHSRALDCGRQVDYNEKNIDGASARYISARYGNLTTLKFLIEQGSSVNTSGGRYGNPLQAAAFHGHERALQFLLDHGADPFAPGRFEDALQAAIAGGHDNSIQYLLSCEDVISKCNLKAALMSVCYAGNHSAVTFLLKRCDLKQPNPKPTDLSYEPIFQALQLALYRGRASVARSLLAQCEDVNTTGGHFGNLIQAAAFGGHETMVRWLIDLGADVHAPGRYGSALRAASFGGHNAVVNLLLHHGARMDIGGHNALQAAALNGHFATVKLLLAHSEGTCRWSACYDAALETASFKGHLEIVHFLLQKGSELLTHKGEKALLAAVIAGHESVVKTLNEKIPRLRQIGYRFVEEWQCHTQAASFSSRKTNARGEVLARHKTARSGRIDVTNSTRYSFDWERLTKQADAQESTASPAEKAHNATPRGPEYLLRIAAGQGSKRMIECLMAGGWELNETDIIEILDEDPSHQPTALDVASSKADLELIDFLLKRGAKLGKTLDSAVRDGKVDVIRMLLAYRPEAELDCFVDPVELQEQYQPIQFTHRQAMSNQSLLAIAVERRHNEIILALLCCKAMSNYPRLGLSMIVAARNGDEETIRVLLEYGQAADGSVDKAIISDIVLQQSFREASENGHLQTVKVLWDKCSLDNNRSQYICISMCEARMHGHDDIMVALRALAQTLDDPRLLGDELITMANIQPVYDPRPHPWGSPTPHLSVTPHLSTLLDQLKSKRIDSKLYVDLQLKALKGALKAGQYDAARYLLEKDSSRCILETETEILHFAIGAMWANDFRNGLDWSHPGTGVHQYLIDTRVHANIIETLIQHGASTGDYDSMGKTPLFYACSKPIPGVFDLLINSKASPLTEHDSSPSDNLEAPISLPRNVNAKSFDLLNVALKSRHEHKDSRFHELHLEWKKIISFLLNLGMSFHPNDLSLIDYLHTACFQGDLECVKQLVDGGAGIHAAGPSKDKHFQLGTALHAAVLGGQVRVVQYLLNIGVNIHQKAVIIRQAASYEGIYQEPRSADETAIQTALHSRAREWGSKKRWHILKILLQSWDGMDDTISDIPVCRDVETVKLLISHNIIARMPPERMKDNQIAAIESNNVALLELLVAQSGLLLPNPLSHVPWFPSCNDLGMALDMIRFLVESNGCNPNATFRSRSFGLEEQYDTNMLLEACKSPAEKIVQFLLEHGADPDGPGLADTVLTTLFRKGRQPLYSHAMVRLLLDHGAEINGSKRCPQEAEKYPRTLQPPLIRAIEDEEPSMVEFLVRNGADVNATSGPETPLHLARRMGFGEIADFLVRHGAVDRYDTDVMGRRVWERPGLTPVTTESLKGHNKLRFP